MGEGGRTGEWGRAGGPGGASLRSSALFPLTQPPSLQGDVVFFFFFTPTCWSEPLSHVVASSIFASIVSFLGLESGRSAWDTTCKF